MQPHIRAFVERAITFTTCPDCDGTRLSEEARSAKISKNDVNFGAMQISDLADWVRDLRRAVGDPAADRLQHFPTRRRKAGPASA